MLLVNSVGEVGFLALPVGLAVDDGFVGGYCSRSIADWAGGGPAIMVRISGAAATDGDVPYVLAKKVLPMPSGPRMSTLQASARNRSKVNPAHCLTAAVGVEHGA